MSALEQLQEFLSPYPASVQELALAARAHMRERFWPVIEIFWDASQAVCLGFTYTHNTSDNFFNFAVYANHVTMIFPWGVKLNDPEHRLRGEGSRVRNLRLESLDMLDDRYVWGLIEQARELAKRPVSPLEPTIIVKVMNGSKRRPS